jgi:Zn-dependent protease
MDFHNLIITLCVYALPVIFAITLHEAAHGFVAKQFGDSTAWMLGRVTLNPIKHIEPLGTVLLPVLTLWLGGFLFGWAKPVPVNFNNLKPERPGMFWVAAAGPGSNLIQMAIWALVAMVLAATIDPQGLVGPFWLAVADAGIKVNIMFALLNLLPILPLDGGHVAGALYEAVRRRFARLRGRPDPGPVDMARLLPVAYVVAGALVAMAVVVIWADIVKPITLG